MWQSSGKFQPRKDQLERIAPVIIEMGCFSRVETNGGAFEQVSLLAGENPNEAVRAFCKPFNEVGIKTHMLDRGLNALRMYPVPDDVRAMMYRVKHAQGVDIPPHLRRSERHSQYRSVHPLGQGGRHDPAGHALHHHLPHPHAGILQQARRRGDCCRSGGDLSQGHGRHRPARLPRPAHEDDQGEASRHHHPVSRPLGPWSLDGLHTGSVQERLRHHRHRHRAVVMGQGSPRHHLRPEHAPPCGIRRTRHQHGRLHEGPRADAGVHRRVARLLYQPAEQDHEFAAPDLWPALWA